MLGRLLIVAINTILFIAIYAKAAGSLSLKKLNFVSLSFFYLLFFCYVGLTLIFLGFRDHYLLQKISDLSVFDKSYFIGTYTLLLFGATWLFVERCFGISNPRKAMERYRTDKICLQNASEGMVYFIVLVLTIIGAAALIYTFWTYGSIPILDLLTGKASETARNDIGRGFTGNQYVRNLLALAMVPALSYLAYVYMRTTRTLKWRLLFGILFVLSVLCKTYNLEKSPVIIYIFYFYFIECMMGKVKKISGIIVVAGVSVVLLGLAYGLAGYSGEIFSLTNGPLSRLFISQIATLFLHVQVFPSRYDFLKGESFATALGGAGIRSGRVVMEVYYPAEVKAGTVGVMNSLFVGEAYANFGWWGVIFGPLAAALITSVILLYLMRLPKDPINLTIYTVLSSLYCSALVGGFADFFYSFNMIFIVVLMILIKLAANGGVFYKGMSMAVREVGE